VPLSADARITGLAIAIKTLRIWAMMRKTLRLSDGDKVGYIEAGQGEVLVLLHGVGMRAEAWGPQIAAFAASNRVIALDMPGHGQSEALPGQPELADYVAWTAKVLRQLGLRANVAGHSMGALMAAGLAVDHPDLVLRLAVLNGVYRRSPEAKAAVQARAAALAKGANDIDVPLARWFGPADQVVRDQVAGWLRDVDLKGYAAAYHAFANGDATYAEAWPQLNCPTLVLTGDGDANSTPEMARSMAQAAPDARAVVIEGHRHMANLTAPEAVNAAMVAWLAAPVLKLKEGMRA
jgi:pimeloyl-ACP methyl ester carboxylesterase